jgi:hypothetical protein
MKNRFIENMIKKSKRHVKTVKNCSGWNEELGLKVYHMYDNSRDKSYWDDIKFIRGSQCIIVAWMHPRYAFKSKNDDAVYNRLKEQNITYDVTGDLLDKTNSKPIYKYLGKNKKRKRIIAYETNFQSNREFFDTWMKQADEENYITDYQQKCEISIEQYSTGRCIHMIAPIEVLCENDLVKIKDIAINHLNDPTYFTRTFGEYRYTAADWLKDFPKEA